MQKGSKIKCSDGDVLGLTCLRYADGDGVRYLNEFDQVEVEVEMHYTQ
jgi:hypothetical protein